MDKLGNYKIDKRLAEGGMATVYLGKTPKGAPCVLKVPRANDADARVALADEARMGSRLKHPAIVETLDYFEHKGTPVLVVAYIDGANLFELREHAGALPAHAVAEIGAQVADALASIHEAKDESGRALHMIHRDVSPGNILVDKLGQARLIDLGIARSLERRADATKKGLVKGTFRYLAPEILEGGEHSPQTDLWALGVTLWEAAVGRYCVAGQTMQTVRAALDGTITALLPGERIEAELKDALLTLVAPLERRAKNARIAKSLLARVAHELPGGRQGLVEAVTSFKSGAPPTRASAATEVLPRSKLEAAHRSPAPASQEAAATEVAPLAEMQWRTVSSDPPDAPDPLATDVEGDAPPRKR